MKRIGPRLLTAEIMLWVIRPVDFVDIPRGSVPNGRADDHRHLAPVSFADILCKSVAVFCHGPMAETRGGEPVLSLSLVLVPEIGPRRSNRLPG